MLHRFFEKYGPFAICIRRFIPVIRGIVSIPAVLAAMDLAPFYLWYAVGSTIFCGVLVGLGFELGDHVNSLTPLLHKGGYIVAALAVVVMIGIVVVVRRRNHAANA